MTYALAHIGKTWYILRRHADNAAFFPVGLPSLTRAWALAQMREIKAHARIERRLARQRRS